MIILSCTTVFVNARDTRAAAAATAYVYLIVNNNNKNTTPNNFIKSYLIRWYLAVLTGERAIKSGTVIKLGNKI